MASDIFAGTKRNLARERPQRGCEQVHVVVAKQRAAWYERPGLLVSISGNSEDRELVARVVAGDTKETERLVRMLTPVVQRRVADVLARKRAAGRSTSRAELLDFIQDVFLHLLEGDFHVLKKWDPERGASLRTFVAIVAERLVLSALRIGKRTGWREDPTLDTDLAYKAGAAPDLESLVLSRDTLCIILDRLREELSPRGISLFYALFVYDREMEEVAAEHDMSMTALYSWKSRVRSLIASWAAELGEAPESRTRRVEP